MSQGVLNTWEYMGCLRIVLGICTPAWVLGVLGMYFGHPGIIPGKGALERLNIDEALEPLSQKHTGIVRSLSDYQDIPG